MYIAFRSLRYQAIRYKKELSWHTVLDLVYTTVTLEQTIIEKWSDDTFLSTFFPRFYSVQITRLGKTEIMNKSAGPFLE